MGADQRGNNPHPVIPTTWGADGNTPTPVSPTSPLPVSSAPTITTLTTGQLTATTTSGATSFVPALAGRKNLAIKNASTTQGVFVGNTGVTSGTGHYLGPGDSLTISAGDGAAALAYFVITAANTALCTYAGWS